MCISLSPYLFIRINICIKVFKTKCGDKILMWVTVFWMDWKMYLLKMLLLLMLRKRRRKIKMDFLQMRFALTCSKTQLSFDWWYLPSIILPFWVYNPRNNHRQNQAFCVFIQSFVRSKNILEAATSDTESYFPTGTKRLIIRTLKSEMWRKSPWTCFIPFQCFIIVETNKEFWRPRCFLSIAKIAAIRAKRCLHGWGWKPNQI